MSLSVEAVRNDSLLPRRNGLSLAVPGSGTKSHPLAVDLLLANVCVTQARIRREAVMT